MADISKMAHTAGTLSGTGWFPSLNSANNTSGLQKQYFADETRAYAQQVGHLASNVFVADCQGLNPADFFEWRKVKLRSIRAAQAQTGETMPEDWQRIYIFDPANLNYLPQGAMLKYNDNTWIVYKGKNISAIHGSAVVRRCNAVIHLLDWYGNIVTVPMSYAKMGTLGNAEHTTENTITSKNYMNCICQLNEYSWQFTENTRIILGNTAYAMRGLDNFTREYTDDPDSVHLLAFTIERTELQPYDSVEHQVADYDGFSWRLDVNWNNSMTVGNSQVIGVRSVRNGKTVENTEKNPIGYYFESSNENVVTVDENGVVTAVAEGTAQITVSLVQNTDITETVEIEVPAAESDYVAFTTTIPDVLHEGSVVFLAAQYFSDGVPTNWPVNFTFSNAERASYGVEAVTSGYVTAAGDETLSGLIMSGGMADASFYRLTCFHASTKPLHIEIECQGYTAGADIYLVM